MATPADQRDIEEAFHAYDTKFEGQISLETILVIFLGLGYQPDNITLQNLQARSGNKKHLNLQETMDVLRQYKRFAPGEDRNGHLASLFQAMNPSGDEMSREQLIAFFKDTGKINITEARADVLLQHIGRKGEGGATPKTLQKDDIVRFLSGA